MLKQVQGVRMSYVDANGEGLGEGNSHYPLLRRRVPEHLWVAELVAADGEDGVVGVLLPGVAVIAGVGKGLILVGVRIGGVDGYYAVALVGKKPGGVVGVDNG